MSTEGDGNGDGDFVAFGEFRLYQKSQHDLCASYRSHIETKIDGMGKNISSKVKIVGAVVSMIVGVLTLINVYLSVVL